MAEISAEAVESLGVKLDGLELPDEERAVMDRWMELAEEASGVEVSGFAAAGFGPRLLNITGSLSGGQSVRGVRLDGDTGPGHVTSHEAED